MGDEQQGLSDEELDRWVVDELGGPEGIPGRLPVTGRGSLMELGAPTADEHAVADRPGGTELGNGHLERFVVAWNGLPGEDPDRRWALLSQEAKQALHDGWVGYQTALALEPDPGAESIVPELAGPGGLPSSAPAEPAEPAPAPRGPRSLLVVLAALAGALGIAALLALLLAGDDDDTATDAPTTTTVVGSAGDGADQPGGAGDQQDALPVELLTGDGTATYAGPTDLAAGATVEVTVRVLDAQGAPRVGIPWFLTIGDPPSSPEATHAEAATDDEGVATFRITAPAAAGPNVLWTSDGSEVWEVAPVQVTDG